VLLCIPFDKHGGCGALLGHASGGLGRVGSRQVEATNAIGGWVARGGCCWLFWRCEWRWALLYCRGILRGPGLGWFVRVPEEPVFVAFFGWLDDGCRGSRGFDRMASTGCIS
jgi:hypothetical protein